MESTNTTNPVRHSFGGTFFLNVSCILIVWCGWLEIFWRRGTVRNFFIVNSALANLLVLLFCIIPRINSSINSPWVLGPFFCQKIPYLQGFAVCALAYSLVAISLERYIAIIHPLCPQITRRESWKVFLGIWIFSICIPFSWLLYFKLPPNHADELSLSFCVVVHPKSFHINIYFDIFNLTFIIFLPITIISYCYIRIFLCQRRSPISNERHVTFQGRFH